MSEDAKREAEQRAMITEMTVIAARLHWHLDHATAFSEGLKAHGVRAHPSPPTTRARTKYVACWGWHIGEHLRRRGHEVLVIERGYVGDRFAWSSLGWNGLNGRATFCPKDDASRFETHHAHLLKPWKDGGDYVLLIGQVPGDASLAGKNLAPWYEQTARAAAVAYGLPVRFRPHPMALKRNAARPVRAAPTLGGTLEEALAGAAIVVTWNSNTAVESVLAGVPTVAMDGGSMAYAVCGHEIGAICKPERAQWAARLAWCQWTMDEIRSGAAWAQIRPH